MLFLQRPSPEEHQQLIQELGPLPIRGVAWPVWVKVLAIVVLVLVGLQIISTATGPVGREISPWVAGSIMLCYAGLVIMARYMLVSETIVSEDGIRQTWLSRREIAWADLHFAKFIPLPASKRLICFPSRGRPVVFQAGTRELQIAFARIVLVYWCRK